MAAVPRKPVLHRTLRPDSAGLTTPGSKVLAREKTTTPSRKDSARKAKWNASLLASEGSLNAQEHQSDSGSSSPDIPDVNERLAYLRPSRELLEFYRKKIAEYEGEHELLVQKLDHFKTTYEDQHKLEWELRQREDEIAELQRALSDMQVYLFQEREQVLRLYAENDRLKIRDLESRKRIQQLLALNGEQGAGGEVSYFFKEPPSKPIVGEKTYDKARGRHGEQKDLLSASHKHRQASKAQKINQAESDSGLPTAVSGMPEATQLALQVEALQAQLEEQVRWSKENIDALLEDRRIRQEEYDALRERDEDKLKTLAEKLHKTQDLLYMSTQDFLQLRYQGRDNERKWMAEKDQLLRELDLYRDRLDAAERMDHTEERAVLLNVSNNALESTQRYKKEVKRLQEELDNAHKLADVYREQVINMEDEVAKIQEKEDIKQDVFHEKTGKMAQRLEIMKARYEELEKRRNLEVEGFQNDIRILRKRLKDMEKQLYKVTLGLCTNDSGDIVEVRPKDIDMAVLRNVRRTASRSQKLTSELKGLKAKVYGIENDLRHL